MVTKAVILAGGRGTRLAEATETRPKPMIEIGGQPILWHIMSIYAAHGFRDFVIACGYKSWQIKEYFRNFFYHHSDITVDLGSGACEVINSASQNWRVTVMDTGLETATAGRVLRIERALDEEAFFLTYGDGVADVDLKGLLAFHLAHGKLATVTAVHPPARFGALDLDGDRVRTFLEKSQSAEGWINGGFFVMHKAVMRYMREDVMLEREPLERLAADGQLMAFRHGGFWQPMDTQRDRKLLESIWAEGRAPWKVW